MPIKKSIKKLNDTVFYALFRKRKYFRFLRLYPRSRNYLFDIINFKQQNDLAVILDVGANTGQSALLFYKLFPKSKIHCFEPVNETYRSLQNNVKRIKAITLHNFALGNKKGNTEINYLPNSGQNSLLAEVNQQFTGINKQVVEIKKFDDFVEQYKIKHIDLLKIDTEGFDLFVLQGAEQALIENKIDFVLCEIGFIYEKKHGNMDEINRYLFDKGYRLVGIYDNYYWGTRFILHGFANALFIRQSLAFSK